MLLQCQLPTAQVTSLPLAADRAGTGRATAKTPLPSRAWSILQLQPALPKLVPPQHSIPLLSWSSPSPPPGLEEPTKSCATPHQVLPFPSLGTVTTPGGSLRGSTTPLTLLEEGTPSCCWTRTPRPRAAHSAGKAPKGPQAGDAHVFVTGQWWLCQQQHWQPCQALSARGSLINSADFGEQRAVETLRSPHSQGQGTSSPTAFPRHQTQCSLLSLVTREPGPSGAHSPALRIHLTARLREHRQRQRRGPARGETCCQHGAAQRDKPGAQQELLLLEEICIYKRVKKQV